MTMQGSDLTWEGVRTNPMLAVTGVAVGAWLAFLGAFVQPIVGLVVGLAAAVWLINYSRVQVRIDADTLTVLLGPWRRRYRRIPRSTIERAETVDVRPMKYGGWGNRA